MRIIRKRFENVVYSLEDKIMGKFYIFCAKQLEKSADYLIGNQEDGQEAGDLLYLASGIYWLHEMPEEAERIERKIYNNYSPLKSKNKFVIRSSNMPRPVLFNVKPR